MSLQGGEQAVAVRGGEGERAPATGAGADQRAQGAVGEELLGLGELADQDRLDELRVPLGEGGVERGVVLTVVADEDPADVRVRGGEALERARLVLGAGAEEAGVGGSPVRK